MVYNISTLYIYYIKTMDVLYNGLLHVCFVYL